MTTWAYMTLSPRLLAMAVRQFFQHMIPNISTLIKVLQFI